MGQGFNPPSGSMVNPIVGSRFSSCQVVLLGLYATGNQNVPFEVRTYTMGWDLKGNGQPSTCADAIQTQQPVSTPAGNELPFTGTDARGKLVAALALVLVGGMLLVLARSRMRTVST